MMQYKRKKLKSVYRYEYNEFLNRLFDIRPMQMFPYLKVMNMIRMNCSWEMSHIIPCTVICKAFS